MIVNIFIVETTFQLLSAMEAKEYFVSDNINNVLIVKKTDNKVNNSQIESIINLVTWDKTYRTFPIKYTKLANIQLLYILMILKFKSFSVNKLFIGEFRSWYMKMFFSLNVQEAFLLDDGMVTFDIQNNYILKNKDYLVNEKGEQLLKIIFEKIFNFKYEISLKIINIFSCFNFKNKFKNQKIIKHNFDLLKDVHQNKKSLNEAWFFGTGLAEAKIVNIEDEIKIIEMAKKYYEQQKLKFIYIPHRFDSDEKVKIITNKMEIKRLKNIAEIEMIKLDFYPKVIVTTISTVLYTLSQICENSEINSVVISDDKLIDNEKKQHVLNIYDEMRAYASYVYLDDVL